MIQFDIVMHIVPYSLRLENYLRHEGANGIDTVMSQWG
jgi:hypothetical protein